MKNLIALLAATVMLAAPAAVAQGTAPAVAAPGAAAEANELATLQAAARTDKKGLVASMLKLTDAEAKKFWPAYDAYQRELDTLARRRNLALEGLAFRAKPITDLYAKSLTNELISVEEQEIKARRKMSKAAMRYLPATKAALYMRLEWNLRVAQSYDIAVAFPLGQIK